MEVSLLNIFFYVDIWYKKRTKMEPEDVLTPEEHARIEELKRTTVYENEAPAPAPAVSPDFFSSLFKMVAGAALVSNPAAVDKSFARGLGFKRQIVVNNISGRKAWIILAPAPIMSIGAIGLDSVGQISFSSSGEYRCQQSPLLDNSSRKFDLDNNQLYYSVFFDCGGQWKVHFKDRRINAKYHDINLLSRHIDEAVDFAFVPTKSSA
jgi:hypothetical protein